MLIYKFTHLPTGKIYIGSLKDEKRWSTYNSSSKLVKKMLEEKPQEWLREILHNTFPDEWTYKEVVDLENDLIRKHVIEWGWDGIWNKHSGANAYSPEALLAAEAAKKTDSWKEKRSVNSKKWFVENPEKAESRRVKITEKMQEITPQLREVQQAYIQNNPEGHLQRLLLANEARKTPEARKRNSEAKKDWFRRNPEASAELYKKITATKQTEQSKRKMSEGQKLRFSNLEEVEKNSQRAKDRFANEEERKLASLRTKKYFSQTEIREEHKAKQQQRFGKKIEVKFDDGTSFQCLGRKALETQLGCLGILQVIKGVRKYATCKHPDYLGKVIVSAKYIEE